MTMVPANNGSFFDEVTASLDEVPLSLSTVAMAVIRLTSDPDVSFAKVARAVSADAGLTAKIIRKANSAFYAGKTPVRTLPLAILKLGLSATRALTISSSVHAMFRMGDAAGREFELWRHSLSVGIGSHIIAKTSRLTVEDEAYVIGILHDIGKLVLLQRFPDVYEEHFLGARGDETVRIQHEIASLGFSHADLGARILTCWNFTPVAVAAVQSHHTPAQAGQYVAGTPAGLEATTLAHTVCLSNAIVKRIESNQHVISTPDIVQSKSFRHFAFSEETVERIIEQIRERVGDELQVFGEKHASVMQHAMTKRPPPSH